MRKGRVPQIYKDLIVKKKMEKGYKQVYKEDKNLEKNHLHILHMHKELVLMIKKHQCKEFHMDRNVKPLVEKNQLKKEYIKGNHYI